MMFSDYSSFVVYGEPSLDYDPSSGNWGYGISQPDVSSMYPTFDLVNGLQDGATGLINSSDINELNIPGADEWITTAVGGNQLGSVGLDFYGTSEEQLYDLLTNPTYIEQAYQQQQSFDLGNQVATSNTLDYLGGLFDDLGGGSLGNQFYSYGSGTTYGYDGFSDPFGATSFQQSTQGDLVPAMFSGQFVIYP